MMVTGKVAVSRLAALCVVAGAVTFTVGFVTPWWLRAPGLDSEVGLWRQCVGDRCTSIVNLDIGDWLIACQALSVTALLSSLMTVGLGVAMVKASRDSTLTNARYGSIATSLLTGVSIALTLAIYHLQHHLLYPTAFYRLSFSFFLVLVAGGLFWAEALILTVFSFAVCLRQSHVIPTTS